jgi:hypothetical protein
MGRGGGFAQDQFVRKAAMLNPAFAEQQVGGGRGKVADRLADRG